MTTLADKIILITGGARGQGAALAEICAAEGASVHIADILDDEGAALVASIRAANGDATYHHLDVGDEAGWIGLLASIDRRHGRLDGLVNNAGISFRPSLEAISLEDWDRVLRINLTGAFLGMKHAAPLMRQAGGGSIVNIGSVAALTGNGNTAYAAAKWGLRGLSKSAAVLLATDKIRVNAVHPGAIATPMMADSPEAMAVMARMTPLQRNGTSAEVAALVRFLLSDAASFMTAGDIEVDGGMANSLIHRA